MNNRFFLGAVAALSIVSANAERLLDSADNCLVVDNEPMVFGSMVRPPQSSGQQVLDCTAFSDTRSMRNRWF